MRVKKPVVGGGVFVDGDPDDLEVGDLLVEGLERGKLFQAWSAPGSPEVEQDDFAAELVEVGGVRTVGDGKAGRGGIELLGVVAAIAACGKRGEGEGGEESGTHRFL